MIGINKILIKNTNKEYKTPPKDDFLVRPFFVYLAKLLFYSMM